MRQPESTTVIRTRPSESDRDRDQSRSPKAPIWAYIDQQLHHLLMRHYDYVDGERVSVDHDSALALRSMLSKICSSSSVYPFISSDGEGGSAATWRVDGDVIQFTADRDGECWCLIRRGTERPEIVDVTSESPELMARLREDLAELTRKANEQNPKWYEIFGGGR
jgi:hypothetical protein